MKYTGISKLFLTADHIGKKKSPYLVMNSQGKACCVPVILVGMISTKIFGAGIGLVETPYVTPLETEIEWMSLYSGDDTGNTNTYTKFGLGYGVNENLATELSIVQETSESEVSGIIEQTSYEFELKWQLSEQGEYSQDWGVLLEYETNPDTLQNEFVLGLIVAKDIKRWTATANLFGAYEWGEEEALVAESRVQLRYRFRPQIEPALEIHVTENTQAIGPLLSGLHRVSHGSKLGWAVGVFVDKKDNGDLVEVIEGRVQFEF